MFLARHLGPAGARWAVDGMFLPSGVTLWTLLELPRANLAAALGAAVTGEAAFGPRGAPLDGDHEVWASGVTYLRSREAREAESTVKDVYARVYEAARPELFWKSIGWRVAGDGAAIRIRGDSRWNVPEPELTLVVNARGEIVGYTAGNDVSSRDIEGENPLYLPQAKVYDGSCALGPGIELVADDGALRDVPIELVVARAGETIFAGETRTARMKRGPGELIGFLRKELGFPRGVFLMTGTGIIPPPEFSLRAGDSVRVTVGALTINNVVAADARA